MSNDLPMRQLVAALRGNGEATARLVRWGLPRISGQIDQYRQEIEYRRKNEWDAEEARKEAMNGNVPPEQTIGALSEIQQQVLRVLAFTGWSLLAQDENAEWVNDRWQEATLQLMLTVHNPTIKYGIIGGMDAEVREEAEEYVERWATEIWGTVETLASDEEITAEDFPPETGNVLMHLVEMAQEAHQEAQQQGGD